MIEGKFKTAARVINHTDVAAAAAAQKKKPYVFGNVIVPRGIILTTLQILIDRFD